MNTRTLTMCVSAIVASAGLPISLAHAEPGSHSMQAERIDAPRFCSGDTLVGLGVATPEGEEVGSVSDMIIERNGSVRYVVIDTSDWLGLDGRRVAVSYSALGWDPAEERLTIDSTKEQLEQFPEFSPDRWDDIEDDRDLGDRLDALTEDVRREYHQERHDPFAERMARGTTVEIQGTIRSITRDSTLAGADDHVIVSVQTDGATRTVALGPTWYVLSGDAVPMRDQEVEITAYAVDGGEVDLVASSVSLDGERLALRNAQGHPLWSPMTSGDEATSTDEGYPTRRYFLLSDVATRPAECRGTACGEIDDVILEQRSGRLMFLVIDPDENFLGIADTNRLVPFTIASVSAKDVVRIDASKEMVLNSEEAPDDLSALTRATCHSIHEAFDVEMPEFERTDGARWSAR